MWFPKETSGIHIAQRRCAHFDEFVCLKAPSVFGQKMHVCDPPKIREVKRGRGRGEGEWGGKEPGRLTHRNATSNQLALAAQPLALGDERNSIALLMDGKIAAVAEDNGICILTVTVVADRALAVLFFASLRLAIHRGGGASTWGDVFAGVLGVWLWYPLLKRMPFLLNLGDRDLENLTGYGFEISGLGAGR